jgi:hypothetical protein
VQLELELVYGLDDDLSWHEWFMALPRTPGDQA